MTGEIPASKLREFLRREAARTGVEVIEARALRVGEDQVLQPQPAEDPGDVAVSEEKSAVADCSGGQQEGLSLQAQPRRSARLAGRRGP